MSATKNRFSVTPYLIRFNVFPLISFFSVKVGEVGIEREKGSEGRVLIQFSSCDKCCVKYFGCAMLPVAEGWLGTECYHSGLFFRCELSIIQRPVAFLVDWCIFSFFGGIFFLPIFIFFFL